MLFHLHARLRVHRAPGIPCALWSFEGPASWQNSRGPRGEIVELRPANNALFDN